MIKLIVTLFFVALLISFVIFFFWAKGNNLTSTEYNKYNTYESSFEIQGDSFTVMTYNIGFLSGMLNETSLKMEKNIFDQNLKNSIELLAKYHPNIIGFQEIDFGANRTYFVNQLEQICKSTNYINSFQSINWDKKYLPYPYWPINVHYGKMLSGQAIVSDFTLSNNTSIVLERPNHPYYYDAFYIDRLIQISEITINNTVVKIMNVHLEAFDSISRLKQAKVVKEEFEKYSDNMPILLIGDFNTRPPMENIESESSKILYSAKNIESAITLTEYENNKENYFTYSSEQPDRKIDYIFFNKNYIEKINAFVIKEAGEISDHYPLLLTFKLIKQLN